MQALSQIQQINQSIMFGQFTDVELRSIIDAVKFARANLIRQNARELRVGDQVKFTGRQGVVYTGTVEGIKIKNAVVATPQGRYRVPMNMLTAA